MVVFKSRPENRDDFFLMEKVAQGDQNAFKDLFDCRVGDVFKLCYSLLLDHQMAEDATQEAFVKLWKHAAEWRPEASVKTWLLAIARNRCLDVLRKKKNDLKKHYDLYKDRLIEHENHLSSTVDKGLDTGKYKETIQNALFLLPERQREAVTLVYYSELHNSEAAELMGLRPAAFDSLLARARRNLRDKLVSRQELLKGYELYGTK